jgi:hypothetical protein
MDQAVGLSNTYVRIKNLARVAKWPIFVRMILGLGSKFRDFCPDQYQGYVRTDMGPHNGWTSVGSLRTSEKTPNASCGKHDGRSPSQLVVEAVSLSTCALEALTHILDALADSVSAARDSNESLFSFADG